MCASGPSGASDHVLADDHAGVIPARDPPTILQQIGRTPLVRLQRIGRDLPVPVFVKCEHLNPGGSIKDRIALAIVDDAQARGVLRPGMTLIEATAGNTGVGLALVAAARGYGLRERKPRRLNGSSHRARRATFC